MFYHLIHTISPFFRDRIQFFFQIRKQEGYGIGDDEHSIAFDGCRQLMWHHAMSESQEVNSFIISCLQVKQEIIMLKSENLKYKISI